MARVARVARAMKAVIKSSMSQLSSVEEPNAPLQVTIEKKVCDAVVAVSMNMLLAEKKKYPGFEILTEPAGSACVQLSAEPQSSKRRSFKYG